MDIMVMDRGMTQTARVPDSPSQAQAEACLAQPFILCRLCTRSSRPILLRTLKLRGLKLVEQAWQASTKLLLRDFDRWPLDKLSGTFAPMCQSVPICVSFHV
jgi:hypothetical protein